MLSNWVRISGKKMLLMFSLHVPSSFIIFEGRQTAPISRFIYFHSSLFPPHLDSFFGFNQYTDFFHFDQMCNETTNATKCIKKKRWLETHLEWENETPYTSYGKQTHHKNDSNRHRLYLRILHGRYRRRVEGGKEWESVPITYLWPGVKLSLTL